MGRAPCCEKIGLNRGPWTREEDLRLTQYIKAHGEGSWRTLPKAAGLLRCGKSCRLRWINYLRPDLKRGNITEEEDRLIMKLHAMLGNRWSLIAARLPGRTDNEIKNYWNTHLKKKLRSLGIDPHTHEPLEKIATPSPCMNFRAKPLYINADYLDTLCMEKFSTFHPSVNQIRDRLHERTAHSPAPLSPNSVSSKTGTIMGGIIQQHATDDQRITSFDLQLTSNKNVQNNSIQHDQDASKTKSDTASSGSPSIHQANDLLTILSDIYPEAAWNTEESQVCSNLESEDKIKIASPASLFSLVETDISWEMESIYPFEAINNPGGMVNSLGVSSDLWGYADMSWH